MQPTGRAVGLSGLLVTADVAFFIQYKVQFHCPITNGPVTAEAYGIICSIAVLAMDKFFAVLPHIDAVIPLRVAVGYTYGRLSDIAM
jgi:hypothetical protein